MEKQEFKNSAQFIARRNVSERVKYVLATCDPETGHLKVVYYTESEPTDDDAEDCELTCGELIAAFPEIRTAETDCLMAPQDRFDDKETLIFSRTSQSG